MSALSGPATFSVELDGEGGLGIGVRDRGDDSRGLVSPVRGRSFRGQEQGYRSLRAFPRPLFVTPLTGMAPR